jgi:hypothetical protein
MDISRESTYCLKLGLFKPGCTSLFIDIFPSNFVIPQEAGSRVKVYGEVTTKDNDPMMVGKMVEINGEIFK